MSVQKLKLFKCLLGRVARKSNVVGGDGRKDEESENDAGPGNSRNAPAGGELSHVLALMQEQQHQFKTMLENQQRLIDFLVTNGGGYVNPAFVNAILDDTGKTEGNTEGAGE